jgi:hypothetical protein
MNDYSLYQTAGNNDNPAMNFISKLQPCLRDLNAEFLTIKEKNHNAESDDLDNLIHKWNDGFNTENTRAKILYLLTEEIDELRSDVKINMYKNHLGGITWVEQVIQRQFYFAKCHFNWRFRNR